MFKALLVVVSMWMVVGCDSTANATGLPPVPTNIVNAPKAQFIGSMITANADKTSLVPTTVTHVNAEFKDCSACNNWFTNSNGLPAVSGLAAKFTSTTLQNSWSKTGFIGYVGSCVDSQTGYSCQAQ